MKIISVVGARPQFIKAAPVCRALRARHEEILVHSGQHYDYDMSDVFFEQLGIPAPDYNLAVGSGMHGRQTGEMMGLLEELFVEQQPDAVLVYGDTNTTMAAGLAAAKAHIRVAHVEAGLRSFDRSMPEEVNRVVVDHVSDFLFAPTDTAVVNLASEGISNGVHQVGDVMLDTARFFSEQCDADKALSDHSLKAGEFYLATVHRAATSDDPDKLASIISAFAQLDAPVLWSVHPRTRKNIENFGLEQRLREAANVTAIAPLPYFEVIALLGEAKALLTDSGGMQKEAYFLGVPCVTLRDRTEWVETVEAGWNRLAGCDTEAILDAAAAARPTGARPAFYGDGHAAEKIVDVLESGLQRAASDG